MMIVITAIIYPAVTECNALNEAAFSNAPHTSLDVIAFRWEIIKMHVTRRGEVWNTSIRPSNPHTWGAN
jgi:hypothetical protein